MPPSIGPVTHVVFDFDGLLVDTEPCYTEANSKTLAPFGKPFTMELKAGQMGRKQHDAIAYLLEKTALTDKISVLEYEKIYDGYLFELFGKAPAKEGAERIVRHLHKHNIPMAICTGSASNDFPAKAASHRSWVDLIPIHVLTGDDPLVKKGKPHPDGYIETMRRFEVPPSSPSSVLIFEDAPNGIRSGLAAGAQCVHIPTMDHPAFRMDPDTEKLITVHSSLLNFDPAVFGLPPFD